MFSHANIAFLRSPGILIASLNFATAESLRDIFYFLSCYFYACQSHCSKGTGHFDASSNCRSRLQLRLGVGWRMFWQTAWKKRLRLCAPSVCVPFTILDIFEHEIFVADCSRRRILSDTFARIVLMFYRCTEITLAVVRVAPLIMNARFAESLQLVNDC